MHHHQHKQEAAHSAAAAWLHATAGRAWRAWRVRLQQSTAKRDSASAALAAWRSALAARCWRAWSGRAAHRQLLTRLATSFICEDSLGLSAVFQVSTAGQLLCRVPHADSQRP